MEKLSLSPNMRRFNALYEKATGIHPDSARKKDPQGKLFLSQEDESRLTVEELEEMIQLTGPFSWTKTQRGKQGHWIDTSGMN